MTAIFAILMAALFVKGTVYKAGFLVVTTLMKEKWNIIPTDAELKECSNNIIKKQWLKILL